MKHAHLGFTPERRESLLGGRVGAARAGLQTLEHQLNSVAVRPRQEGLLHKHQSLWVPYNKSKRDGDSLSNIILLLAINLMHKSDSCIIIIMITKINE